MVVYPEIRQEGNLPQRIEHVLLLQAKSKNILLLHNRELQTQGYETWKPAMDKSYRMLEQLL
jgi:hypothetical protein